MPNEETKKPSPLPFRRVGESKEEAGQRISRELLETADEQDIETTESEPDKP
jgi:hypothetical protein